MRRILRVCPALLFALAAGQVHAKLPEVIVDPGGVPPAALQAINSAVDAIARLSEDQDGGEIDRLRRRARDATLAALATQGYFTPTVTLTPGTDVGGETWDIAIEPGPRARVASVDLKFTGRVARPEYAARIQKWRDDWALKAGQPFINGDWNKAKSGLLDAVSTRDFLLAHMTHSLAEVDAETAQVRLSVEIDSGPAVRMGALQTDGLQRVPESLVRRYVKYSEGAAYDQDKLDQWQQELQSTAFFRGAFVTLDQGARGGQDDVKVTAPGASARAPGSSGLASV
ncbi:autotransporter assembly complex protein TamA, partial [Bordetella pertussis]